ncbi:MULTISPECIES: sigma-70 family RNA polymerase sigma factor [unclassified Vibrio]|uniref:sigma-70 family RNA polymerase sigma factor n=1 Tax=unclassified Vibrio TaxID=2614977 RepID=UPI000B8E61C8|nr:MULTISPECIES: sigma-70 family RNA polymerase sigma factor [unclassified Vibrio]OXX43136.1 RNA polymerase subunit sigma [Vibrio sp. V07_P2A8T137]OXX56280.1 RNA polymerase subunit sigma [Vibrio sp. V10_P2A27P122]PSD40509.1 RNA polymerase subunit sigma [Vibrio sp. V02_P2A34T13]HCZ9271441.1 sigma-70 family RNA polymerase sigma factor [Vibrio alginolyticus]
MSTDVEMGRIGHESDEGFDDPCFISKIREEMLKFARLQLRDEGMAEDAVQEALLAAHRNIAKFGRKSAFKTWVFAILKNKIIDLLRKNQREVSVSQLGNEESDVMDEVLFNQRGYWHADERPIGWSMPMESVKDEQFWLVFETCLNALPENLARVFMMREFVELESDEICQNLGLTTSNLHVMLYRSRLRLRECLENKWFRGGRE